LGSVVSLARVMLLAVVQVAMQLSNSLSLAVSEGCLKMPLELNRVARF
jgi:hypothetical protein